MPIVLTPAVEDAISTAIASRDHAAQADTDHASDVQSMLAAQAAEEASKNASLAAHVAALDDAHAAIDALTALLSGAPTPVAPPA